MKLHTINQYISEISFSDFNIDEHYLTLIDAPTGCGKTETMFSLSKRNKSIIAFPYTSQVIQQEQYRMNYQFLYEHKNFDPDGPSNICCTYDKLSKLINYLDIEHYTLHLDECHNLYVSSNFRSDVMFLIANAIRNFLFKKVIFYSSTYNKKYLNDFIEVKNHQKIVIKEPDVENLTCVHVSNGIKHTLNEQMLNYFLKNNIKNQKILIFRNSITENETLAELLNLHGFNTITVNSEKKNEDEILSFLKKRRIEDETSILITTSILSEGISIENHNITQIHYLDKQKSATSIRQFSSRVRKSNPEVLVWFKNKNRSGFRNDIQQEKEDFNKNHKEMLNSFNNLLKYISSKKMSNYGKHIIESNKIYGSNWRKNGFRYHAGEIILDFTQLANYFYNLEVQNESFNSLLLGETLEKYGFTVHYLDLDLIPDSNVKKLCKSTSKKIKLEKKETIETFLDIFMDEKFDPKQRKNDLIQIFNKSELQNKEFKLLNRWIKLKNKKISNNDVKNIILKNKDELVNYRTSLEQHNPDDMFYNILLSKIQLNVKYDADERNRMLIETEQELNSMKYFKNMINIKKTNGGEISGRISKKIFMDMFNCKYHFIKGKPFITVLNFDPIFFKKTEA